MTKKTLGYITGAIVLALTLSGCFRVTQAYTLNEDGTVNGEIVYAFLEEFAEDGNLDDLTGGGNPGEEFGSAVVTDYKQDGYVGTRITFKDEPLSSLPDEEQFSVVRDGDDYVVTGSLGSEDEFAFDGVEAWISITFPGTVSDHNGTLSGNTVTWNIADGQYDMSATGSAIGGGAAGGGIPSWVWIALALIVLGGGGAFLVLQDRKSKSAAEE